MKTYRYKAKKGPREVVEGTLSADTQDEALDKIHELGLVPVDLNEETVSAGPAQKSESRTTSQTRRSEAGGVNQRKIKSREIAYFYRQLASLVKSGVPLVKGFQILSKEHGNPHFRTLLAQMEVAVREGQEPHVAFGRYPQVFTAFDRGMIQAGEKSGTLDEILVRIAQYRANQQIFISKVRSALIYPAFVVSVGILSMVFMLAYVVPKFTLFFQDLGQELPLMTRILIRLSDWMQWGWIVIAVLVIAGSIVFRKLLARPLTRKSIHALYLKLPVVGVLLTKAEIANLSRSLALLLRSGIPVLAALRGTLPVLTNEAIKADIEVTHRIVEEGGYLSQGLSRSKFIPGYFVQIVGVGEESGKLEDSLNDIAAWYEFDTEEAVRAMTGMLEPAIILFVGLILGLMIMAVLLPIFSMSTMVS